MLLGRMDLQVAVFCLLSTILLIGNSQAQSDITFNLTCVSDQNIKVDVDMTGSKQFVKTRTMVVFLKDHLCNTTTGHGLQHVFDHVNNTYVPATQILHYKQIISFTTASKTCDGTFINGTDDFTIMQTAYVKVTDVLRTSMTERVFYYQYNLKCTIQRNYVVGNATTSFIVDPNKVDVTESHNKTDFNDVQFDMNLYTDANFEHILTGDPATVSSRAMIYVEINQTSSTTAFMFVTKSCSASRSPIYNASTADKFFKDSCSLDPTFKILSGIPSPLQFKFEIQAFFYIDPAPIYFHCSVYVCEDEDTSDACKQICKQSKRRRRDIEEEHRKVVVSSGPITFNNDLTCSAMSCPLNSKCYDHQPAECICDDGYVMSTETDMCVHGRQFWVKNIRLDQPWDASTPFHKLASKYRSLLLRLFHATKTTNHLEGLKVLSLRKGSVILDIVILHTTRSSPQAAYNAFVKAINTDILEATTVRRIIKLVEDSYVPTFAQPEKKTITDIQLIIIVFTIAVVALLFVISMLMLKHKRDKRVVTKEVISSDNMGMEIYT